MNFRIIMLLFVSIHSGDLLLAQDRGDAGSYYYNMKMGMQSLNMANSSQTFQMAAENFEQIALNEKTKWIPYYHAAYCYIQAVFLTKDKNKIKELIKRAQPLIDSAKVLHPGHSEIVTLQGLLYEAKIMIDPSKMTNKYLRKAVTEYDHARFLDKENPRPYYLLGKILYQLPEKYGNKENACEHFQKAADRFKKFKPRSEFSPNWGEKSNQFMLKKCR